MISLSKPKSLMSNASWSLLLTLWQTGVSFFYTPFLIRHIGSDMYGLFVLLMSIAGLLGIMNLGLGEATLRYVAYYSARDDLIGINRVVMATFTIYGAMAVFVATTVYISSPWIVPLLAIPAKDHALGASLLRLTAISFGFILVGRAIGAIPNALQRYDISTKALIGESLFQVIGSVTLIFFGYGIFELVLWGVVTSVIMQPVYFWIAKRLIPQLTIRPSLCMEGFREVFSYGIFAFFTQILGIIWGQADRILLGTLVSSSSVAYFTVPQNLAFRASYAVNSAGGVLFPKFSATTDRQDMAKLFSDSSWLLLSATVVIFVPLTVLMPDFLRLWITPEFSTQSAWVGQIVACSCLVRGAFVPYDSLFKGIGKPQYLTVLYLCSGITSLVANAFLIPRYGLSGAGYCYALTPMWGFLAILLVWTKLLAIDSLRPLVRIIVVPLGAGIIALMLCYLIRADQNQAGWTMLFFNGALFIFLTASLVLGFESLFGRTQSRVALLLSYICALASKRKKINVIIGHYRSRSDNALK